MAQRLKSPARAGDPDNPWSRKTPPPWSNEAVRPRACDLQQEKPTAVKPTPVQQRDPAQGMMAAGQLGGQRAEALEALKACELGLDGSGPL